MKLPLFLRKKIAVTKQTDCWIWHGARHELGYGRVQSKALGTRVAHRVVYECLVGEIPEGMLVCHHCDNPCCVNPRHLFVGTSQDNTLDMFAKGRQGRRKVPRPLNRGSSNGNCRMTEEQVKALRHEREQGAKLEVLAFKYGCSLSSASRLSNFKTHKESYP